MALMIVIDLLAKTFAQAALMLFWALMSRIHPLFFYVYGAMSAFRLVKNMRG